MKTAIKIIAIGVLIIMSIGLIAGCNSGLWFNVGYNDDSIFGQKENGGGTAFSSALVVSFDEMRGLCEEWNNAAYQESNEQYLSELNKKIREYDDDFFVDKAIIIIQFSGGNAGNGYTHNIKSVKIENDVLIVNRQSARKRGTWNDYAVFRVYIIEVNKTDIQGVTKLQVNEIKK